MVYHSLFFGIIASQMLNIFMIIQCVLYFKNLLVSLEETEKNFELGIRDRVILDVDRSDMESFFDTQKATNIIKAFCANFAV